MVLLGAEYHTFPISYTEQIREVASKPDLKESRAHKKWLDIEKTKIANIELKAMQ